MKRFTTNRSTVSNYIECSKVLDTIEHARLFKSISNVQKYLSKRSMRANMRSAPCAVAALLAALLLLTRAHSDMRTIYADTVEHARLFESTSSVQRYSLQRSMRANMRGSSAAYTCT